MSAKFLVPALGLTALLAVPAGAAGLPAPYVSRALDAVLIPIDASVRDAFGLGASDSGVLVLATAPGGVAEAAGIAPGDVIEKAHGKPVTDPITLDEIVWYWIQKGAFDFVFDAMRGGQPASYTSTITLDSYTTVIDVTTVSTWESYSYESFSYSEYTAEYASEISESYESSENTIEETASSEEFAAEETTEESASDAGGDEAAADDGGDAAADDGDMDQDGDSGGDDGGGDDGGGDDGGGDEVQN